MTLKKLKTLFLLFCFSLLCACERAPEQYKHSTLSFGTLIEITVSGINRTLALQAFEELENDFKTMHASWTSWEPGPVQDINQSIASGMSFDVDKNVLPLILQSVELHQLTEGYYNPTIGRLIRLWRFDLADEAGVHPPQHEAIQKLVDSRPSMDNIQLAGNRITGTNPNVEFNFGAFAKGVGVRKAILKLKKMGINNAIVNAGGDLCATGKNGTSKWRIGVRHPRQSRPIAAIELNESECAFTSGDYERYYFHEGRRYHHILDPDTGYPATGSVSVTVVHEDGGLADAAATALFVAGAERWQAVASKLALEYVMLIDNQENIHVTRAMYDRLEMIKDVENTINVVNLYP